MLPQWLTTPASITISSFHFVYELTTRCCRNGWSSNFWFISTQDCRMHRPLMLSMSAIFNLPTTAAKVTASCRSCNLCFHISLSHVDLGSIVNLCSTVRKQLHRREWVKAERCFVGNWSGAEGASVCEEKWCWWFTYSVRDCLSTFWYCGNLYNYCLCKILIINI